jgi:hypothetical protein
MKDDTGSDVVTYLCINVKDAPPSAFFYFTDSSKAGAIVIPREFSVFDEGRFLNQLLELLDRDEKVVFSVDFPWTWCASGVLNFYLLDC